MGSSHRGEMLRQAVPRFRRAVLHARLQDRIAGSLAGEDAARGERGPAVTLGEGVLLIAGAFVFELERPHEPLGRLDLLVHAVERVLLTVALQHAAPGAAGPEVDLTDDHRV